VDSAAWPAGSAGSNRPAQRTAAARWSAIRRPAHDQGGTGGFRDRRDDRFRARTGIRGQLKRHSGVMTGAAASYRSVFASSEFQWLRIGHVAAVAGDQLAGRVDRCGVHPDRLTPGLAALTYLPDQLGSRDCSPLTGTPGISRNPCAVSGDERHEGHERHHQYGHHGPGPGRLPGRTISAAVAIRRRDGCGVQRAWLCRLAVFARTDRSLGTTSQAITRPLPGPRHRAVLDPLRTTRTRSD
jgi:hypothetical protein